MTATDYATFLAEKSRWDSDHGFDVPNENVHASLRPFQRDIVRWALRRGRAAVWADCGLGKTIMQLEWARKIVQRTGKDVLILAPLAVASQTKREGEKFGIDVTVCREQGDVRPGINITNYEMLEHFDPSAFVGVVVDESSILKSYTGKFRTLIIESFKETPYRLACTATPAPNDFMEIANHAEFLGTMTRAEMLAMFFVHDGGETQSWRLKGHAQGDFWRWVCSWAVMLRNPADLGYDGKEFVLPPIRYHDHVLQVDPLSIGVLFEHESLSLQDRRRARKVTIDERVAKCAELVNSTPGPWVVWCELNDESKALAAAIHGAVEVEGADSREDKERALMGFVDGSVRVLVTKPKIAGFGMNWQHCANMAFVGVSDSFEMMYQSIRRCWRFGQEHPVNVHFITSTNDDCVLANVRRKEEDSRIMFEEMAKNMHDLNNENVRGTRRTAATYAEEVKQGDGWTMYLGDCVEIVAGMPNDSIDYSIFSPPFASLYTYSNSDRDMGNCKTTEEFKVHLYFLIQHLFRVVKPGRLLSFHCMNLPTSKARDGVIGIKDFRGELIRSFEQAGWIYHSEVCIWKDPVTAMQRTKALGLLHKQIKKDSCMSRQGIPDYLVTMRKPGENVEPVSHTADDFPVQEWQRIASPVWMDIDASDTLQYMSAREDNDERHICPLQLEVIRRGLKLWSNPGDTVLSPFGGIASEGHVAIEQGRKYVGVELKRSYFEQAVRNLDNATKKSKEGMLFQ